jgi:hypothetical protein
MARSAKNFEKMQRPRITLMARIFGTHFFPTSVIRVIRGSAAFAIWQLRFAWDLEIGIWNFPIQ